MKFWMTRVSVFIAMSFLITACASLTGEGQRRGVSSSLVDYLYPDGKVPPKHASTTPELKLPLSVGLAFVPATHQSFLSLPEATRVGLLETVKEKFAGLEYVKEITIVPETYMRSSKGFEGVNQIARLYGLDVVALVSYDQVSVTSETKSSVLYWTIVGAYFVKGNQNQVTTFVDAAVFDVKSQKLLFRAPGVSDVQASSTLVEVDSVNRTARGEGFELAVNDMSKNLALELENFRARIKEDKSVQISHSKGYGGGGSVQWPFLILLLCFAVFKVTKK